MGGPTRESRLIDALVTLADTLVADYDVAELVQYLVDVSIDLLDAAAAGLVLADGDDQLDVLASTSGRIELLEVLQIRTRRGPCFDCYTTGTPQTIPDVAAEADRWPQFATLALREGFRSVHAVPMRHHDRVIGALNLFRGQPGELAEPDRRAARALADVATIGILQHRTARHTAEVNDQLRHALSSRVVIEQAKGILAHYGRVDMDHAFIALRGYARRHQLRLTDLAQALVDRERRPADILGVPAPARPTTPETSPSLR